MRRAVADHQVAISQRGAEIEAARRLPPDIVELLRDCGVFRLLLPAELGGIEAPPEVVLNIVEDLSWADGSVGWCALIGLGTNALGAVLPEAGAREIFTTAREITGGAFMPCGTATPDPTGGFLLSGEWPFGSGIDHCDWICGAAPVTTATTAPASAPDVRLFFVPQEQVEILDTWHVAGLQGTGSQHYRITDRMVPDRCTVSLAAAVPWPAGTIWRIPILALILPIMGAVPLGIARRAIDELVALATRKTPYRSTRRLAERDVAQAMIARAQATTASAQAYLHERVNALWQLALAGDTPALAERAAARLAAAHAAQSAAEATRLCYQVAGASALYNTSPLQRAFRDAHATTQHYVLSHPSYETAGRVLLGLEPDVPL